MKKVTLFLVALLFGVTSWAAETQTASLTIIKSQSVASLSLDFVASSDGSIVTSEGNYLKAGSNSKKCQYIRLETEFFNDKLIKKVQVWGTSKANSGASPKVYIGGELIGEGPAYTSQNAESGGTEYSVENNEDKKGALKVEISRASAQKGALYFNKLIVTFTDADTQEVISLDIQEESIEVEEGKTSEQLTVVVDPEGTFVTWKSLNENIATVLDGKVTGLVAGETKVVALAGDKSDTCLVIVKEDASAIWYDLATNATEFVDGDRIMIAKKGDAVLMSKLVNTNSSQTTANFSPITTGVVAKEDFSAFRELESAVYTMVEDGDNWKLQADEGQFLTIATAKKAYLSESGSSLEVSADASGVATIKNPKATGSGTLQYNPSAKMFTTYTSYQGNIAIYRYRDPNAGRLVCTPKEVALPSKQLIDKAAEGSAIISVSAWNITDDGLLISLTGHHPEFSIEPADVLPAAGGEITLSYKLEDVMIQAADTTLVDTVTIVGQDKNGKTLSFDVPVSVTILKEYFRQSITTMLQDSINQVGAWGQNNTDLHEGKDLFLLDTVVLVYAAKNEYIVRDATGFLAVKGTVGEDWTAGDKLVGLFGRLNVQHKRYFFTPIETQPTKTDKHIDVAPEVFTDAPETYQDLSRFVRYEGVKFGNAGAILLDGGSLATSNLYGVSAPDDVVADYNVEGIVSRAGKHTQLILTSVEMDPNFQRPVTGVRLSETTLELNCGETAVLVATVLPEGENPIGAANKNITWSIDNATVAKVEDGTITAMHEGTAIVTVTTEDGGFKATCTVTVKDIATLIYERISSVEDLVEGDKIMLVGQVGETAYAAAEFGTKNFSGVEVTVQESYILSTNAKGAAVFTLGKEGDYWTLSLDGQLLGKSDKKDKVLTLDGTGVTTWRIATSEECDSIISTDETYNNRFIVCNGNQDILFNAYSYYNPANKMYPVKIYKVTGKKLEDLEPDAVVMNPTQATVVVGGSLQLDAEVAPSNSMYRGIIWESMATEIATVSESGLVQALQVGEAKIVAKSERNNELTDTCFLTVRDSVHVSGIAIMIAGQEKHIYKLKELQSAQLEVVISPEDADNQDFVWSSSDENIATINAEGLLEAKNEGEAIITATSLDNGVNAELKLTVTGKPRMECAIDSVAFEDVVYKGGELVVRDSFDIVGRHLEQAITLEVTGEGFSAASTTLPAEGGRVYIDFNVTEGGVYTGTVLLSSGNASRVAVRVGITVIEELTIARLLEKEPEKGNVTGTKEHLLGDVTVTYQNGDYLYVRDETGSLLIKGAEGEFTNGTILRGVTGVVEHVKYNPQLNLKHQPTAIEGEAVAADTLTAFPERKDLSRYVVVPGLRFKKAADLSERKPVDVPFDEGTLTVFNTYSLDLPAVDDLHVYDILGTLMKYGQNTYEVSPIAVSVSDEPYMRVEWNSVWFDNAELPQGTTITGSESLVLDTVNIKEVRVEGTDIFSGSFADGKLTVTYEANEGGFHEGIITITGIPSKEGAKNIVLTIAAYVDITEILIPHLSVDKDEVIFDSVTVKYMEHQTGSAVVKVTAVNVKNLTVSNSNKDVFDAQLDGDELTITYDVYKQGEFNTTITLKAEPEQAGQKVDNVTIRARISVGQLPEDEAIEQITNDPSQTTTKIFHEGQLYILRAGKIYTVTGAEVK